MIVLDGAGSTATGTTSISADGAFVGGYVSKLIAGNPGTVAAVWNNSGARVDTPPIDGLSSGVLSVDTDGSAVGWTTNVAETDFPTRPAAIVGGSFQLLPGLPAPAEFGGANSTRNGVTIGTGVDSDEELSQPWVHSGATTTPLGTFGGSNGAAYQVNASGQVVGWSQVSSAPFVSHGFVTLPGQTLATATHITGLGGTTTFARSINDAGVVVGDSQNSSGVTDAFMWTATGGAVSIASPAPGRSYLLARSINNHNQVVGAGPATSGGFEAWYWDASTGKQPLASMVDMPVGWQLTDAWGIADNGAIAAQAKNPSGASVAVVLRLR